MQVMDILKIIYLNLPFFMLSFDLDVSVKFSENSKNPSIDRIKNPTNTKTSSVSKRTLNFELEFFRF